MVVYEVAQTRSLLLFVFKQGFPACGLKHHLNLKSKHDVLTMTSVIQSSVAALPLVSISVTSNHIRNKQRRVIIVQQSFHEYTSGVKSWISEGFDFVWLNRKFKWTPIWHSVYCFLNRNKWAWLNYGTTLLGNDNEYYKYLMKVNYQLGANASPLQQWPHSHCNSQWSCWCSITSPAYQE